MSNYWFCEGFDCTYQATANDIKRLTNTKPFSNYIYKDSPLLAPTPVKKSTFSAAIPYRELFIEASIPMKGKQWTCPQCGNKKLRYGYMSNYWFCQTFDCFYQAKANDIKQLMTIRKGYQQYQDLTKNEKTLEEEIQDLLKDDLYPRTPVDPKCECGGAIIGDNMHSIWCPAYKSS